LSSLREGKAVHLETDIIGKYMRCYLPVSRHGGTPVKAGLKSIPPVSSLTLERLRQAGFGE